MHNNCALLICVFIVTVGYYVVYQWISRFGMSFDMYIDRKNIILKEIEMKTTLLAIFIIFTTLFMVGCESNTSDILVVDEIPQPPQGVYSVTGDGAVYLYWNAPYETDIASFTIWRSFIADSLYTQIGEVNAIPNPDLNLDQYVYTDNSVTNGVTYYYAVATVDEAGQESEQLSAEMVFDTPRPEGTATLFDTVTYPALSAMIFGEPSIPVSYTNSAADFFVDELEGILYINAADVNTDIQDMGFTDSLEVIGYAPDTSVGWSTLRYFELIEGHTYVFWTRDNHYAKVRVLSLTASSVNIEWAFQTDAGNPELVQSIVKKEKPVHSANYLKKNFTSNEQ